MGNLKDNSGISTGATMSPKPRGEPKNTDDPRGRFGAFLRHWIDVHHSGDTQRLADALGLNARTIRTWMKGDNGPAFQDLDRVAQAMGYADFGALGIAVRRFNK